MRRRGGAARRDPSATAREVERHALRENTDAVWLVAADAWEEAGDPVRARYTFLRQPSFGLSLPDPDEAVRTRDRSERWQKALKLHAWNARGVANPTSWRQEDEPHIDAIAGTRRPTNEELSKLEVFQFALSPPDHLFGYYDREPSAIDQSPRSAPNMIRTFASDPLGRVVEVGGMRNARGTRLRHVMVKAINGWYYRGWCNLTTGTYCRLKKTKYPWLHR